MRKRQIYNLPIMIEKDEEGFYVVECPILPGCYTQGKTLDEALANIKEVVDLILEEKDNQKLLQSYQPKEFGLHTLPVTINA